MNLEYGSLWRRWDFHVHTPYSILNNEYGFDPEAEEDGQEHFDDFVKRLFLKALDNNIAAIGITDYFSIDGYKRIRQEYLGNTEKMEQLFPDQVQRARINDILVFSNIEFRLNIFVGRESKAVNYHVFFSERVDVKMIEECFLQTLKLPHEANSTLPLTRRSIEIIGHEYKVHNSEETRPDYLVGMERITVSHEDIMNSLRGCTSLANKYLISIPVDEDLSRIDWSGRDYQTRKILYQQCDMLLTSNDNTRKWALAKGREKEQLLEFKSIKPCIWGSDAHSYERLFSPRENRFCWIKADPTFEGLQQILYEPEDRVRIQKDKPEEKDEHQIIDYIVFEDKNFQIEPVYLNEGLNAIIGGKSTGKSILIRHIAKCIDPKQVDEREKTVGALHRLDASANVFWKDGVSGNRKIIYIPQSWLNRVVDDSTTDDSQLNTMLRDILLQQEEIKTANIQLMKKVKDGIAQQKHDIIDFISAWNIINDCEKKLQDSGRSDAFKSAIKRLEEQRNEISTEAGITEEDLKTHTELEKKIAIHNGLLEAIQKEETCIGLLHDAFVYFPNITVLDLNETPCYILDEVSTVRGILDESIKQMNKTVLQTWDTTIRSAKQVLSDKKLQIQKELNELQTVFSPLQQIVSRNELLKKIDIQLHEERKKLQEAENLENQKSENIKRAEKIKDGILSTRKRLQEAYDEFTKGLSLVNNLDSNLKFEANTQIRSDDLFDTIYALFDNRNLRSFKDKYGINIFEREEINVNNDFFNAIWNAMTDGTLSFKGGNTLQTALERLFSDWFYVHYSVKSGEDTINNMSPGKKALVLLEMIVNLEKGKCPILIDQPEDDLDNRSIYTHLLAYLKTKKHERQIIVVTHNANVVVGADAEEVIIANQTGQEAPNREKRFEYRSGSIENTTPVRDIDGIILRGVLNQKGIQEQICDILEGGKDAFELRRRKYISSILLVQH